MTVLFRNSDITIYNKYSDKVSGVEKYQRTVIEGVNWQAKRNATVNDKGLNVAYSVLILIDKLNNYIEPRVFKNLSDKDRVKYFTFGNEDKIVKGKIDFEITGLKGCTLVDLMKNFDNVFNLTGVIELSGHWEVEGK